MKIHIERDFCISSGSCVLEAPAVFDQDDDGVVVILTEDVPEAEEGHAREAVDICPASVLRLV